MERPISLVPIVVLAALVACGNPSPEAAAGLPEGGSSLPPAAPAGAGPAGDEQRALRELVADENESATETNLAELEAATLADPTNAEAWRRLGLALMSAGRATEGLAQLRKAVAVSPADTSALLSLGTACSRTGRLDEAEKTYRRLLEVEPTHARAMNNLGNVALRRGLQDEATSWYRRAVDADPTYLLARHKLAGVLKFYGRYDDAYATYEALLELEPRNDEERHAYVDSMYSMGFINVMREQYESAERQLSEVLRRVPAHRHAHYARAQALIKLGRPDEARAELAAHMQVLRATGDAF